MKTAAQAREELAVLNESRRLGLVGPQPEGNLLGRLALALTRCMINGRSNATLLANDPLTAHDEVIRAAVGAHDNVTAAALLQTELASVIAELAARVPLLELNATETGMTASSNARRHPRVATGMVGGFVAEGAPLPASAALFDSVNVPALSKWGSLVAFTVELTKSPVAAQAIQALFIAAMGRTLNLATLSSAAGTTAKPPGLFHASNAAAPLASTTLPADVVAVAAAMANANYALNECAWVLAPATLLKISTYRGPSGALEFPLAGERQILGARVLESADAEPTRIALLHEQSVWRSVIVDPSNVELSETAMAQMDSAPVADLGGATDPANVLGAWQRNMILARCIGWAGWQVERTQAIQHAVVGW